MRQTEYIERPSPSVGVSVLVFLSILTVIMTCMQLGSETSMAVLFGAIVAMMAALLLGTSWQTIEICILENIK